MQKILIIDIETTGFSYSSGKIVEIGIVELDLATGEKQILFDQVCREEEVTSEEIENSWIVQNSTLTSDQILSSQFLHVLAPEIQSILNKYEAGATAFNNTFDFGFMESRGFVFPKKLPCPMKLSTDVCKIPGKYGFKWPKVEEAHRHFFGDTGYVELHRGADDAFHEADIVYALFKMGVFQLN
ncbi:exonuclease domain-containing protein [Chryseobacterium sp. R2A-55]|uniref:exonuclease domain-containing protein n=1 Tax=Chryseobacterium sp. R2A-55 TaxID=2744445 RepID=UPI001F29EB60|nr:exonuclease domain-containing protein [Chryseobacterium sp. R2A-55]